MLLHRKFHLAIKKDVERKKAAPSYKSRRKIVETSIGANVRRSRALNLSEIVKRHRGSFTNFQFDYFDYFEAIYFSLAVPVRKPS